MKRKNIYNGEELLRKDDAYMECIFTNVDLSKFFGSENVSFGQCEFRKCILPINANIVLGKIEDCIVHKQTFPNIVKVNISNCRVI